jgi:hypothetical protein
MRLLIQGALASLLLASPSALADRPAPVKPDVLQVLGQTWCLGQVPAGTHCDLRLLPDAPRPSSKPADPRAWLDAVMRDLRQHMKDQGEARK